MEVKSLDHIHIYSAAPEQSAGFYIDHFGAAEVLRNEERDGRISIFLSLADRIVILGTLPRGISACDPPPFGDGAYTHGFGIAHVGIRVDDVEAAVRELDDAGVEILDGPFEEPGIRFAYIAAPDGVVLELTQYEAPGG
jgi:catechol 2,3-dioxygenase-like lactoylglutathione lyase family enzyme